MKQDKFTPFLVIFILLIAVVAFAFSYNASVTTAITNAAYNDSRVLHEYNDEIIEKLIGEPSVEGWSDIIEQYEEVVIVIENSENDVVTRSRDRNWTALDVKVQTPFQYKGSAYLIKSSVYLFRDYITDAGAVAEFIFTEFLIGLSALGLFVLIIYTIILRPYKVIYNAIEEYDKTGKFKKVKIRGYAGQVYRRFAAVTESLTRQQNNERRIIASISHDIKTPLTSIMGYTERLKNDSISPERKERYLETVYAKSREIHELVDEFDEYLSYNMIKELRTETMKVSDIATALEKVYIDELESEGIGFEVINSCSDEMKISVDAQKLTRVFSNIITNSLKHFNKQEKLIRVVFRADRKKLYIDFSDNGEGVEQDKLEIIFEPLYTSDEGRKVAGLGLANCREIIAAHDGRIYAEKAELGGLKICIEFNRNKNRVTK